MSFRRVLSTAALLCLLGASPVRAGSIIQNVLDFDGQPFVHVDFETASGQDSLAGINAFLSAQPHAASLAYTGAFSQLSNDDVTALGLSPTFGGGFDGGAVSGTGHLLTSTETTTLSFATPVDAVGFFFGGSWLVNGSNGGHRLTVTFSDDSTTTLTRTDLLALGFPGLQNSVSQSSAINGFIGYDADGGLLIKRIAWRGTNDTASIDDIIFGTANVSGTIGARGFAENFGGSGTVSTPLPQVPEPGTVALLALGLIGLAIQGSPAKRGSGCE